MIADPELRELTREVGSDSRVPVAALSPRQARVALELAATGHARASGLLVDHDAWETLRGDPAVDVLRCAVLVPRSLGRPVSVPSSAVSLETPCTATELADVLRWLAAEPT